jgi:hypothetical protein
VSADQWITVEHWATVLAALVACGALVRWASKAAVLVSKVSAEFSPNGGSSLRDQVDHLKAGQAEALESFRAHAEQDAAAQSQNSEQFAELTRLIEALSGEPDTQAARDLGIYGRGPGNVYRRAPRP